MTCSVGACERPKLARGYCSLHWGRWRRGKPLDAPKFYNRLNKGWIVAGYHFIMTPDGREMLEHRYVMEQALGRPLLHDEDVHHKDGNRLNNRLDNLEVLDHAVHTSLHQNEGGERRPAVCPECGKDFLRISWRPHQTCSRSCGLRRMWRRRRQRG